MGAISWEVFYLGDSDMIDTSILAIMIAIITASGSALSFILGKRRLQLDSDLQREIIREKAGVTAKAYAEAAGISATALEKAMLLNLTLQTEVDKLKLDIIDLKRLRDEAISLRYEIDQQTKRISELKTIMRDIITALQSCNRFHDCPVGKLYVKGLEE